MYYLFFHQNWWFLPKLFRAIFVVQKRLKPNVEPKYQTQNSNPRNIPATLPGCSQIYLALFSTISTRQNALLIYFLHLITKKLKS